MNFFHVLTLVLLVLKVMGYFPHSWWLVFAPSIVLVVFTFLIMAAVIVVGVAHAVSNK